MIIKKASFRIMFILFITMLIVGCSHEVNVDTEALFSINIGQSIRSVNMRYPYVLCLTGEGQLQVYSLIEKKELIRKNVGYEFISQLTTTNIVTIAGWYYGAKTVTTDIGLVIPGRAFSYKYYNKNAGLHPGVPDQKGFIVKDIRIDFRYGKQEYRFIQNNIKWIADPFADGAIFDADINEGFFYYAYLSDKNVVNICRVSLSSLSKSFFAKL